MTTWRERIAEMGVPTADDVDDIAHWETCAIGEQYAMYPKVVMPVGGRRLLRDVGPVDVRLSQLGLRVSSIVEDAYRRCGSLDRAAAHQILDDIEARVLELKREAGSREGA